MKKFCMSMALLLLVSGVLTGCKFDFQRKEIKEAKHHLYYISADETELVEEAYKPKEETPQAMMKELMQFLKADEASDGHLPLLPADVKVTTHAITEGTLTLDFNEAYRSMKPTREVLTRAGVVKLFVQLPDIKYVKFTVEGKELADSNGMPISIMNNETFMEYSGENINSYQYATIDLYFTNEDGTKLIPEERTVYYNSNVPLEKVVLEQLMKGPETEGVYPTLPSHLTILGVTTDSGNCYFNLDSAFLEDALPTADSSIAIYSIVNSIVDDCRAKRVQISINGENNLVFKDSIQLDQFFAKNSKLIQKEEE
ncbi:MAG: GerMN domain-containing protein [Lachnospiraceae bacterium]|nr:GerMN domain-containing protein [Lachnospiraceae bacterium]MDD6617719.1 GerMN domain-containing protein [Clostridiales bacterium]MDY4770016.1 GerMN domain-containing protein [Lachnospiraceae bacterium]